MAERTAICNNCGDTMPDTGHRACEACRAEWRLRARKPGGPAEQKEILKDLLGAAKDMARMLEAVRVSAGLGKGQADRLAKAKSIMLKAEGALRS